MSFALAMDLSIACSPCFLSPGMSLPHHSRNIYRVPPCAPMLALETCAASCNPAPSGIILPLYRMSSAHLFSCIRTFSSPPSLPLLTRALKFPCLISGTSSHCGQSAPVSPGQPQSVPVSPSQPMMWEHPCQFEDTFFNPVLCYICNHLFLKSYLLICLCDHEFSWVCRHRSINQAWDFFSRQNWPMRTRGLKIPPRVLPNIQSMLLHPPPKW